MAQQNQQQPESGWVKPRDAFSLLLIFANVHAACLHPFLRRGCGVDVPGIFGVGGLLLMGVYAESTRSYGMVRYIGVWLVALIVMRIRSDRRQHSRYLGYPALVARLPPVRWARDREASAKAIEPVFCVLAGAFISQWSEPVGSFVAAGVVSLAVIEGIQRMLARREGIEINNATVRMEHMAERRNGGW